MNDLVTTNAAASMLAAFGGASNPFTALGNEVGNYSIFCKFDGNIGVWKYGKENTVIEPGTKIIMNMASMERGFICWKDGQMLEEMMSPYPPKFNKKGKQITPIYTDEDCEDHGPYTPGKNDGWSAQTKIVMAFYADGVNLEYKTSAKGAQRALFQVSGEFGDNVDIQVDDNGLPKMPVVELSATDFTVKKDGSSFTKYAPIFTIVDWITIDDMNALTEARNIDTQDDEIRETVKAAHKTVSKKKKKKKNKKQKGIDFKDLDDEIPF